MERVDERLLVHGFMVVLFFWASVYGSNRMGSFVCSRKSN